ncbi:MAG: hypothetical protein QG568_502 [Patescibacteria group bacterium]|nr:hypothetical protein [Patescibacteria group bacterium]
MKIRFVVDTLYHHSKVRFPIYFVPDKEWVDTPSSFPEIPPILVFANSADETQLPEGINLEVREPLNGCLQVKCRVDRKGVVSEAIKAALVACNSIFTDFEVEAAYEITPLDDGERRAIAREIDRVQSCDAHPWD